ncbi:hypothetical protein JG688_00003462 [Phytophthora aleatoria]|uniref:ABC transporter family G domain-containing protein n=1 Tax=Phytophthora aleatoria TaxID=2496075 RepID=A0A8J5IUB3_9STRA|nr:hypothetical protein JG688_00003462 [Phytophthora aleatoria]
MVVLMAVTGAAKPTLMPVYARHKTSGRVPDIHLEADTIYEELVFSANLRLDMNFSYIPRMNLVHNNLDLLDLTAILWAVVGGLYDEQKERVPGGVQMVGHPGILSMDELTSGLDTRSGLIMMCGVQSIALTGLLSTIHQPSISLFELFNGHLLLQRGGYTAYFGDLVNDYSVEYKNSELYKSNRECNAATDPTSAMPFL